MTSPDIINRLRSEHDKLRSCVARFGEMVGSSVPCDMAALAAVRWDLGSTTMRHLIQEDRHVYAPLQTDRRPAAVAVQAHFRTELRLFFDEYVRHAKLWTPGRIIRDWPDYSAAVEALLARLVDRMDREERQLYPLLADIDRDPTRQPPHDNWAREAFAIKDRITEGLPS